MSIQEKRWHLVPADAAEVGDRGESKGNKRELNSVKKFRIP